MREVSSPVLCRPGAARGPPFNRPCNGTVDTGLRRYDDGGGDDHRAHLAIRTLDHVRGPNGESLRSSFLVSLMDAIGTRKLMAEGEHTRTAQIGSAGKLWKPAIS